MCLSPYIFFPCGLSWLVFSQILGVTKFPLSFPVVPQFSPGPSEIICHRHRIKAGSEQQWHQPQLYKHLSPSTTF